MSIHIDINQPWQEISNYEVLNTIDGKTEYIQTTTTQSIMYVIYITTNDEFNEFDSWIRENITEESQMLVEQEDLLTLIILKIYTKESVMAFKLRWL